MKEISSDLTSCLVFLWADRPVLQELTEKVFINGRHQDVRYISQCFHTLQRKVRKTEDGSFANHVAHASWILYGFKRDANTRLADCMIEEWNARFAEQTLCRVKDPPPQKLLAFSLGKHARLGVDSLISRLNNDLLKMILDYVDDIPEWMDQGGNILP
mmetsp:Transcript_18312/g.28522  ORF Transcript_18312/g.28522 Transcript_18312/m.28522 type:complete len:158 (+) Transcript_18312:864-1337(+)